MNERPFGIIYMAYNVVNGKFYIGQTVGTLVARKKKHISDAMRGRKETAFAKAIKKHGAGAFQFSILKECSTQEQLNFWECFYIALFGGYNNKSATYNMKDGGVSGPPSESVKNRQSALLKVKYKGDGNPFFGKIHSIETRALISKNRKGKLTGQDHPAYGKAISQEKKKQLKNGLLSWLSTEDSKKYLSNKNSGDKNPYAVVLREDQKITIVELKGKGYSIRRIQQELGLVSYSPITRLLREKGIPNARYRIKSGHKITEEIVREIRSKYIPQIYSAARLAKEYSLSQSMIVNIIKYKNWKHV